MVKKGEIPPDEVRCRRTDGRQWRCIRRVVDGKKLCHIHYLQGRRRQLKQKVPESMKLERTSKKIRKDGEKNWVSSRSSRIVKMAVAKKTKQQQRKRCVSEVLDEALRRMKLKRGDLQLELIREFLKRQVEKKRRKRKDQEESEWNEETAELTRVLPNGVMAISQRSCDNAAGGGGDDGVDVKIGEISGSDLFCQRSFRSKNIEPLPISTMQVVPFADYLRRLKKCHWCRRRNVSCSLIKSLKCRKHFFCGDCIKERYFKKNEIKVACPVCRGSCSCRICREHQSRDISHKEFYRDKRKIDKLQLLHYLISVLFPVLKQINRDQSLELEMEAMISGKVPSEVQIQQSELGYKKLHCCNNCKTSILDYHRSCANCSYNLCLSCCWEFCRGGFEGKVKPKGCNENESCFSTNWKMKQISTSSSSPCNMPILSPSSLQSLEASSDGSIFCPPADFGGCGERNLDLRCIFPFSWMKELEAGAEGVLQSYEFPETSDLCSCDSVYDGTDNKFGEMRLQKLATRADSNDNFIYCPMINDLNKEKIEHFRQHWAKGHPVIIRNVIRRMSILNWDPIVMFCAYLEKRSSKSQNKNGGVKGSTCLDWCEVETSAKQIFMGSMAEETHVNVQHQTLKIKAWLSSHLFQEQFPSHYDEILHALPLQEYVNPITGLLNLALKLPQEASKHEIGPCIHISFGGPEEFMQADFLTKLCYDSNDVVNILAYATDVPITREQFKKIKMLIKKYKDRDHVQSIRKNKNQDHFPSSSYSMEEKGKSSLQGEESEVSGLQDMIEERVSLPDGIGKVPFYSGNLLKGQISYSENETVSLDSEDESEFDSEASILCSKNIQEYEDSDAECFFRDMESAGSSCEKEIANSSGAQWDIFRRQDVPKLLEYLRRHSDEITCAYGYSKQTVHPILDQNFFLDPYHKMRLKEEFDVQPWTFNQHPGEAIVIPAGCPYQIRKLKSSVNVVLDFISPENTTECIRLSDEIHLLPKRHKAREKVLEVRKMTACGISAAIEEIQKLMCTETTLKPVE